jgi:hypothetical protein
MANGDAKTLLPEPDFTCTPADCAFVAGIRPVRKTFRLESENVGSKFVVHNYGHGGAGITMSWGCAVEVLKIVQQHAGAAPVPVAVLGGGVMGLTAATLLVESRFTVAIYASSLQSLRRMSPAANGHRRSSTTTRGCLAPNNDSRPFCAPRSTCTASESARATGFPSGSITRSTAPARALTRFLTTLFRLRRRMLIYLSPI